MSQLPWHHAANEILGDRSRQAQQIRLDVGCILTVDSRGRKIWTIDAHCDDGKRFMVRANEKLTAFLELESAIEGVGP